jgi:hypothetical protein
MHPMKKDEISRRADEAGRDVYKNIVPVIK